MDDHSFASSLQGGFFTFSVGLEAVKFDVHQVLVAKYAPGLDALMKEKLQDSSAKVVELPHIDPDTFVRFASFCYNKTCKWAHTNLVAPWGMSDESALEIMKMCGATEYACLHCSAGEAMVSAKWLFPYCSHKCASNDLGNDDICVFCGAGHDLSVMVCKRCQQEVGEQLLMAGRFDAACYGSNLLDGGKGRPTTESGPGPGTDPENSNSAAMKMKKLLGPFDFIQHAKLYYFAEAYQANELRLVTLATMSHSLNRDRPGIGYAAKLFLLIQYIYQRAASHEDKERRKKDNMLTMIVRLMVEDLQSLVKSQCFQRLLEINAEFKIDLASIALVHKPAVFWQLAEQLGISRSSAPRR